MKKFIMCVFVVLMCSSVDAKIDRGISDVHYNKAIMVGKKSLNKKPIRMIIRKILDKRKMEKFNIPKLIPIPLYDSINHDRMRNLA